CSTGLSFADLVKSGKLKGIFRNCKDKIDGAIGRLRWRTWLISHTGAKISGGSWRISTKKEKRSKKESQVRKGRPVETATAVEIRTRWPSATSYWWISTAA